MDWLKALYPDVRTALRDATSPWAELRAIVEHVLEGAFSNAAMLTLAACRAVGGQPQNAIPIAAALIAFETSLRILDDLVDQDRSGQLWQEVGPARAFNYAMALQAQAFGLLARTSYPPGLLVRLQQVFTDALTLVATGQDRDLQGLTRTVDDYWLTIELKSATAFSAACMAGAVVGTSDDNLLRACSRFGHHAGLAIQVFNDLESIWLPEGQTDLQQGKVTLPLVYALQRDHPDRDELVYLVENNLLSDQAERVREIFDLVDAKSFMLWAALKEREQALAALEPCPDDEGRAALSAIITGMFGDLETLAP